MMVLVSSEFCGGCQKPQETKRRVGGIVLSVLALLGSSPGVLFVVQYLTSTSSDSSLAYVVGLIVTVPSLLTGVFASRLLLRGRRQNRFLARWFWLPVCPPILVMLGLHVMLLFR